MLTLPKCGHQKERWSEIWQNGSCISFKFMIQCSRCKSSNVYMFEKAIVNRFGHCTKKCFFPCWASVQKTINFWWDWIFSKSLMLLYTLHLVSVCQRLQNKSFAKMVHSILYCLLTVRYHRKILGIDANPM